MKKIILILVLSLINLGLVYSQEKEENSDKVKNPFWENVQFGGGINLGFSNNVTNIGISPSAIYNFNEKFSTGIGVSYLYSKFKNNNDALNLYGGSLITLYKPIREMQFSAEFEENIITQSGFDNRNIESLFFGAGYSYGRNLTVGIRYDVLYNENESIYGSALLPFVRVYF